MYFFQRFHLFFSRSEADRDDRADRVQETQNIFFEKCVTKTHIPTRNMDR